MKSLLSLAILTLGGLLIACAPTDEVLTSEYSAAAVQQTVAKPLVAQRADPFIYRTPAGRYYFIATAPEFDRIELRAADSLTDLKTAEAKTVWRKHNTGAMGANIWAPELHYFDNTWYIYFAAGDAEKPWLIRMYVLANSSADPLIGDWQELGQVKTARDSFALDATSFEHKGQRYLVWAQKDPEEKFNSALYISKLISPTQVDKVEVEISRPELDWEIQGYKVNEGAAVIIRNGKIFISYSASATDHRYTMGLLWADADSDLLAASSWNKLQEPVFTSNSQLNRYGPGHNSFTLAGDGQTDIMVYHARDYLELQGTPLTDPNRHTYIRRLGWTSEGFPDFGQDKSDAE